MVHAAASLLPIDFHMVVKDVYDVECDKAELMYEALAVQSVAIGATQYAMVLLVGTLIDDMVANGAPLDEVVASIRDAALHASANRVPTSPAN